MVRNAVRLVGAEPLVIHTVEQRSDSGAKGFEDALGGLAIGSGLCLRSIRRSPPFRTVECPFLRDEVRLEGGIEGIDDDGLRNRVCPKVGV